MEINAAVHSISKLKDYFFLVPDYQREYVWKVDDQVEQFLEDIDNEYDSRKIDQKSYFIGSIIIVKNAGKYDVIDGQQRLTTIVLTLCAFRDLLSGLSLDAKQQKYLKTIEEWLSDFDIETDETQVRLELQYDESKDFLSNLILGQTYSDEVTASIKKMQQAHECIKDHLIGYLDENKPQSGVEADISKDIDALVAFARYFLTKIELVVIESENLSSALKIFETINQRGAGLNAMDLVKNLLFSQAKESDFQKIKDRWKEINRNLQACNEEQSPLRFLRYFLMARYHDGILREDEIYKWIISAEGKKATSFEANPLQLANELVKLSKRYADLVNATMHKSDGGEYPAVTRIGFINKYKSRQHLVLLLALKESTDKSLIEALANELESFFFFSNTMGIQAKYNERLFTQWAVAPVTREELIGAIWAPSFTGGPSVEGQPSGYLPYLRGAAGKGPLTTSPLTALTGGACNDPVNDPGGAGVECSVTANLDLDYTFRQKVVGFSFTRDLSDFISLGRKGTGPSFRTEVSHEFDKPFNSSVVADPFTGQLNTGSPNLLVAPEDVIEERDVTSVMIGFDYPFWVPGWESQEKSIFTSVQFFNIHTEDADNLLSQAPYSFNEVEDNQNFITFLWEMRLDNQRFVTEGLYIRNVQNNGTAYRQRLDFNYFGKHWRPRIEWQFFDGKQGVAPIGLFNDKDFVELSITYQF